MRRRPCGVAAGLLLALGCAGCGGAAGAAAPEPAEPAEPAVETGECSLGPGPTLRLTLPRPEGFAVARSPEACMVAEERGRVRMFYTVTAVRADAEGKASLLAGTEGALTWARESELFEAPPREVGRGSVTLTGERTPLYRLVGRPVGIGVPREAAVARIRKGAHYLVVLAIYDPEQDDERRRSRALMEGIRIEEEP